MKISAEYTNGVLRLGLNGEIDEYSASNARRETDAIIENHLQSRKAVFDLNGVSFMDSTGIGFLIGRYKKFQRFGIPAYITNVSPSTDKILTMSGIYTLMPRLESK
jgi:stage II sporulation protein AA (anti-sigma F factor antagonist)